MNDRSKREWMRKIVDRRKEINAASEEKCKKELTALHLEPKGRNEKFSKINIFHTTY